MPVSTTIPEVDKHKLTIVGKETERETSIIPDRSTLILLLLVGCSLLGIHLFTSHVKYRRNTKKKKEGEWSLP